MQLVIALVMIAALLALPNAPARAGSEALSDPMPASGEVDAFEVSPDQRYVVYRADRTTDQAFELFSVPIGGGPSVRIHPLLPSGQRVGFFVIAPDSKHVVYTADFDGDGRRELHSTPIAGPASASVQLSAAPVAGGAIGGIGVTPNAKRVVYHGDVTTNDVAELYSVPITGPASATVKLNLALADGGDVMTFQISADGKRVVFGADRLVDERFELFSVPVAGPAAASVRLNPVPVAGGDVDPFGIALSADSARVVYRGDLTVDDRHELFSVPIIGPSTASARLNKGLPDGGDVEVFALTKDARRVVYIADQVVAQRRDLFSVPIDGPAASGVKLNPVPVNFGGVISFRLSDDSTWAVYRANQDDVTKAELYSVLISGPAASARKVSGTLPELGDVTSKFMISPDSARVVYIADQGVDGRDELYSVPTRGPATEGTKLNGPLTSGGDVAGAVVASGARYVAYRADQLTDEVYEIFAVPIAGPSGSGFRLNGSLVAGGDVLFMQLLAHGTAAVYLADQDVDGQDELYLGGTRAPRCNGRAATIAGDAGDNTLVGTKLNDVIVGLGGNDLIKGKAGSDTVCAGLGADVINGGLGKDTILGNKGNDRLLGAKGNDILRGKEGRDVIRGQGGRDTMYGGLGNDSLFGGDGIDIAYGQDGTDTCFAETIVGCE